MADHRLTIGSFATRPGHWRWFFCTALLLAGCGEPRLAEYELAGPTMGTSFSIRIVEPPVALDLDGLGNEIRTTLETIEQRFSTYRPSSELSLLNANLSTDWIATSAELCHVVADAIAYSRYTNGAFDITVGPLVLLWGFGPGATRSSPPEDDLVVEARSSVGYDKLGTDCAVPAIRKSLPGVSMDLSAIVKGHAADTVAGLILDAGATDFLVEIGGELRMNGHNAEGRSWAVAIEKPEVANRAVQAIVPVTDRGVATSGDYRNFFEHDGKRYSHTIDPGTGRPVTHSGAAVTVIGDSAKEADALATALLVMGPETGLTFAEDNGIAAYFLLHGDSGIEAKATSAFDDLAGS